ncbi:tetratricopeptide repeat protein [Bdellovibrio bacteriovorus]|uniref:tetratricopeptide repeat protein n=1 Tax=Bdellovibrio TaxID=958 RepID=UPI0035A9212C
MKKSILLSTLFLAGITASAQSQSKNQDYRKAANQYYKIIFSPQGKPEEKMKARFYLAQSFLKLKLYQTAAFPFIVVAQNAPPKPAQTAFENLVEISEQLNDTGLLDYTLKKLDAQNLNEIAKDIYLKRMAQALMREGKFDEALGFVQQALQLKSDSDEALYTAALIYLKQNNTAQALPFLEKLYNKYFQNPITDVPRGRAAVALARAYYQAKRWNDAATLYREIPKDHPLFREAQMELTWALFRAGKLRSAMSTVQTLHTPFYENFYDPESLILRTIILIFVCQNEEAEKALENFQKNYTSAFSTLSDLNKSNETPAFYFTQIEETQKYLKDIKNGKRPNYKGRLPLFIVRSLLDVPPLKNKLEYIARIQDEKTRILKTFNRPEDISVRKYAVKILDSRLANSSKSAGESLRYALYNKEQELAFFTGDIGLLRYEILNGKKLAARKEYIKRINNSSSQINASETRDFYVKNGYRYWPFEGEYWRDEIGNYQYLGVNRCVEE